MGDVPSSTIVRNVGRGNLTINEVEMSGDCTDANITPAAADKTSPDYVSDVVPSRRSRSRSRPAATRTVDVDAVTCGMSSTPMIQTPRPTRSRS
jgi:hypothetical protein